MATDAVRFAQWFSASDLPSNRAGHLAPDQARRLGLEAAVGRSVELFVGVALIVVAIVFAALGVIDSPIVSAAGTGPTLVGSLIVGLVGLVVLWAGRRGSFSHQVATGEVDHVTGPAVLTRTSHSSGNSSYYVHYLGVGQLGLRFEIDDHLFHAITEGETLTAYYLAGARHLVNLEPAAEAQAAGVTDPAAQAAAAAAAQVVAGPPDGTPLPQAIIGRWRMEAGGPMGGMAVVIEFRPDGTAVITPDLTASAMLDAIPAAMRGAVGRLAQPRTVPYHWTDGDHLSLEGQGESSQVRLSGGQLIIQAKEGEQHLVRLAATADTPASPAAEAHP
jgi:hypothetical protein